MSCEFCSDPEARPVVLATPRADEVTVALCPAHREAFSDLVVGPIVETA